MFNWALLVQACLLIIQYYFYVNDKKEKDNPKYLTVLEVHHIVLFVTLIVEGILVLAALFCQERMGISALQLLCSGFILMIRAGTHYLYILEVVPEK